MTKPLFFASCQADNTFPVSQALANYLSRRISRPVIFLEEISWQDAYQGINSGEIELGWICGWPYTQIVDELCPPVKLLVAPVMRGDRYGDVPRYYSDVVVRRDSEFATFTDLRGGTWAYNEPGSQSGYHIIRYQLATMGEDERFFGRVVQSGSHARSLSMILDREVDSAAIDTTVLEWEIERDNHLAQNLRVIATLGPSPIPPIVASTGLPEHLFNELRDQLLLMNTSADGQAVLDLGCLTRFSAVTDSDYDEIRRMGTVARTVTL